MKLWLKLGGLLSLALCLGYCANVTSTHQMELGYGYPPTPVVQQIERDWERSHPVSEPFVDARPVRSKALVRLVSAR